MSRAWKSLAANNSSFYPLNLPHHLRCLTYECLTTGLSRVPLQGTYSPQTLTVWTEFHLGYFFEMVGVFICCSKNLDSLKRRYKQIQFNVFVTFYILYNSSGIVLVVSIFKGNHLSVVKHDVSNGFLSIFR